MADRTASFEEHDSAGALSLDGLIAAVITLAGEAIQRRVLLQSIDWAKVDAARVATMLQHLDARGQRVPPWLVRALLVAGHGLPDVMTRSGPLELDVLNRLNHAARNGTGKTEPQTSDIDVLRLTDNIDADVLRAIVGRLTGAGHGGAACAVALAHWHSAPAALVPVRAALPAFIAALPKARVHVTAFSTLDVLCEDLKLACAAGGWAAEVTHSAFGEVIATLMTPRPEADAHMLLLDMVPLIERDWRSGTIESQAAVLAWVEQIASAVRAYASRTRQPLIVNTLPAPAIPTAGWIDASHGLGARMAVDRVNAHLVALAREHACVHLVDADAALADVAPARRNDAKLWYYGRLAYSAEASRGLARAFALSFAALRRAPAKVLAIDLDNTLWGGVFGDDGIERLQCGEEAPGNAFQAFQRECLRLKRQGMILVALSKNNVDAIDVLAKHPGMLLRREDFAATAINWQPKPENLHRIADELRLGLDSFLFLDDSPHEREAMRRLAPQVFVPEMPADPAARPEWLRRLQVTWPLRLTDEDEQRAEFYAAETQAKALKATAATFEDYLRGLEQRLVVTPVSPASLARAAQMHQRTNQFNLTTRRLTEGDITTMTADPAKGLALLGRVRDKFGDHGLTIAATATLAGQRAEIVTFLMSCRVIGREIERAFLGALINELRSRGVQRVTGTYLPTAKNALARDLYASNGFRPVADTGQGSTWEFVIGEDTMPSSAHVSVALEG